MVSLAIALMATVAAWATIGPVVPAPAQPAQASASNVPITLKKTDEVKLAVIECTGPYWTIGPFVRQARQLMDEHGVSGPLLVRYLRNPRSAPADTLRSQIGFAAPPSFAPKPPLTLSTRPAEWVVARVVEQTEMDMARDYPPIFDWIRDHNYKLAGPVTELFTADAAGRGQVEIQVAVELSEAAIAEIERSQRASKSATPEPGKASTDGAPEARPALPASIEEGRKSLSIAELVANGDFDGVAGRLIREDQPVPPGHELWFGQVMFRLNAISRGVEQRAPGTGTRLSAMTNAILSRYRATMLTRQVDSMSQPVARVDVHSDPFSSEKLAILRDLDVLLMRIGQRSADGEVAFEAVARLLPRIIEIAYPP